MTTSLKVTLFVAAGLGVVLAGLIVAGWLAWGRGNGVAAEPMPDFATLALPDSPNHFLVLPASFGSSAVPRQVSPVFDLPVGQLEKRALDVIRNQPRITQVASDSQRRQYAFVQRTPILRFPDTVTVQFVAEGNERSSIALYSRSKVGYSDLGENEKRVKAWLAAIIAAAEASAE